VWAPRQPAHPSDRLAQETRHGVKHFQPAIYKRAGCRPAGPPGRLLLLAARAGRFQSGWMCVSLPAGTSGGQTRISGCMEQPSANIRQTERRAPVLGYKYPADCMCMRHGWTRRFSADSSLWNGLMRVQTLFRFPLRDAVIKDSPVAPPGWPRTGNELKHQGSMGRLPSSPLVDLFLLTKRLAKHTAANAEMLGPCSPLLIPHPPLLPVSAIHAHPTGRLAESSSALRGFSRLAGPTHPRPFPRSNEWRSLSDSSRGTRRCGGTQRTASGRSVLYCAVQYCPA